ncbi:MAG: hypothetical protein V4631_17380 [Pseudomonadota bacterium]
MKVDRIDWERADVLTVAHDNDRSLLHKGKYYSPLIDTMEDELARHGVRAISVARIISRIKGELSYGRVFSPEGAFARSLLGKRVRGVLARGRYPYSASEEAIWGRILDQTKVRKVFGIQPSRELCVACHKRGVWVADVQHGVIADGHPWYGVSFRDSDPVPWLPSAFLCWDPGSAAVINGWSEKKGVRAEVIGNRWLARFARPAPDDALVHELAANYQRAVARKRTKPTILLTLSWGNVNIPNGHICPGLEAAIRSTSGTYRWIMRLHPNQLNGFATHEGPDFIRYFNKALAGHAEWEDATGAPLPVVLQDSDLHISWNSSVCIEAAQMGIRSALLDPQLRDPATRGDYYTYYRQAGMVVLLDESEQSVVRWIEDNIDSKHAPQSFDASDAQYQRLIRFLSE